MRISDLLAPNIRSELFEMSNGVKRNRNNKTSYRRFKERLTRREIKELMGMNRDRYHRVHGKVKRK